jgi:hypothetical protein
MDPVSSMPVSWNRSSRWAMSGRLTNLALLPRQATPFHTPIAKLCRLLAGSVSKLGTIGGVLTEDMISFKYVVLA